jgi:hypothetical protein
VFCSAAERSENTQTQPCIQVSETTRHIASAFPAIVSICDDLRFEAIIEATSIVGRGARAAAGTDKLTAHQPERMAPEASP